MTTLANFPLFILFYAMSPLWAKAAIYTGITIGIAKAITSSITQPIRARAPLSFGAW